MSPVFVKLRGPDVSNGTLPEPSGPCGSTKVGFTSIHAFYFEIWFQTSGTSMDGERNKNDCFNNLIQMIVKICGIAQFTRATKPGNSLVLDKVVS